MKSRTARPTWQRYGVAVGLVVLATVITVTFQPWLAPTPLAPFYAAVALAAWYGGVRPAALTILLSAFSVTLWGFPPFGVWFLGLHEVSLLITFFVVSGLITALSASRDRAEEELRASERRFRTMVDTANEGLWLIDRHARTQYTNDRMAAMLGTTPEHVMAGTVADFVFPEDIPVMRERIGSNLAGQTEEFDFRFRRVDGEELLVLAGTSPVSDSSGRVVGALGLFTDITARRRTEIALAQANERFALAADAVQAMIYEWDIATDRVERSSGLLPLLGYRPDQAPSDGAWWRTRIHPDDLALISTDPGQKVTEGNRYSSEYRIRHHDGRWVTVWDQGQLVRNSEGQVVRVVGSAIDITEWKDAENALRLLSDAGSALASSLDYEETLQRVSWVAVPEIADWCVVDLVDERGGARRVAIAYADPEQEELANKLLAYPPSSRISGPEELVIQSGKSILIEQVTDTEMQAAAKGPEHLEIMRSTGVISAVVVPLRVGGQIYGALSLATTSASDRRLDQDDLALAEQLGRRSAAAIENARLYRDVQAAEARYRGLFEGTEDGIIVFDLAGTCFDINPALAEMVGFAREDLIGSSVLLIASEGPWSNEEGERLRREGQWRGEFALRRKNGTMLPVESRITAVELPTGPVYVGVLRDVSERKRFDQLQEEFLSALAHDLKNPLMAVRGQTQLLRRRIGRGEVQDPDRLESALESIDTAAARMTRLLDELTDITRLRTGHEIDLKRSETDLVALAQRTIDEHTRMTEQHTIRLHSEVDELRGFWDGTRLERVLGNLLGNAIKYSPAGGEITVNITQEELSDGDFAILSVQDRGVGIPAADLSFIFEHFRRAANVDSFAGSGIGLAGTKRIVELHGGTISVTSTEGQGSTFTVRLPITEDVDARGLVDRLKQSEPS